MSVHIDKIRIDGGTQARACLNDQTVAEYAEAMEDPNTVFPPITLYFDGKDYWLADGFHRLAAWRQIGRTDIPADVRQGDRRRAILHSVAANSAHGLRRTNEDKRRAVLTLLEDDEWSQWSDREIARRCAVDHKTVGKLRAEHLGISPDSNPDGASVHGGQIAETRTVQRNGTTYQQNTANIGARPAAVCQEALDVLKASKADDDEVLDAIKDLDPAAQVVAAYREVQKRQPPQPKPRRTSPKDDKPASVPDADPVEYLAQLMLYATNDWQRLADALHQVSTSEIREVVLEAIADVEAQDGGV